jgi:hypothetical protein
MEVIFGTSKNYLITSTYEDAQVLRSFQLQELYESRIYKISKWIYNFHQQSLIHKFFSNWIFVDLGSKWRFSILFIYLLQ